MVQKWDNRNERNKDLCEVLVASMRRLCDAVIDTGGLLEYWRLDINLV